MIFDKKENSALYKNVSANMKKALDYLESTDFASLEAGKYPIDGDNVYALVQEPNTKLKADARWEGHKNYIDIQYLVSGSEIMGVQDLDAMTVKTPYDGAKDIVYFEENGKGSEIKVDSGFYAVFFPTDAHRPLICVGEPKPVKKVVIKVKA